MRKVCRMHRTYIFSSRFDWNASRWMIRKGRHTRPTRSALAYNGEFFPITNAPCLRCIVENASPFSIVFSQLETEWLTIPISFVSFFSFPPSSFRFLCLLFFFLYYTRGRFYFILFFFFFFLRNRWRYSGILLESLDRSGIWNSNERINDSVWNHDSCIDSYRCWLIVWG